MTGGSLLSRTLSVGSLQQHPQNGGLHPHNPYAFRKTPKTSVNGYRDKDRLFSFTFRCLSRRKIGMLILAAFALLAFLTGFFTVNKEDDLASPFDARYMNKSYIAPFLLSGKDSTNSTINRALVCEENIGWGPTLDASDVGGFSSNATILNNPCKDFAFPPPPPGDMRRIGPRPCPVCYVPVEQAVAHMPKFPSPSPVLLHLTYFSEENPLKIEPNGGSDFGGYPSLNQRNDSFNIKESMTIHCGFVKGCKPGYQTGFDIDVDDIRMLEQFHEVIVASAIFGNYDVIQQPRNIGETARKNVPFFMFVDEETETYMKNSSLLGSDKQVGLWRIIVVHNVPYTDPRRNGKVPKLLLHRLFPNVRYSIWIDGKLQLVVDPYQILERFLWRQNATYAISRHYTRFDVFAEAEANKAGGKYDNVSIDNQIEFYKTEGLTPYTTAKLPITSDVPEGCVIVREHIPITNLFSCLWFNEVDRFTSRDQLSFSTVRDKVVAQVDWSINMFLDCERRNFVIQAYHRDLLEQRAQLARARMAMAKNRPRPRPRPHPPPPVLHEKSLPKRRKDKKPGSRRRRRVIPKTRENSFI